MLGSRCCASKFLAVVPYNELTVPEPKPSTHLAVARTATLHLWPNLSIESRYCATNGLAAVSGNCDAGYYCMSGAVLNAPVGQDYGGQCTAGHYCEEASAYPEPCPLGTYYGALVSHMPTSKKNKTAIIIWIH